MKNQMVVTIKKTEYMNYEVTYEIQGDPMKWLKKNGLSTQASDILDKAEACETTELTYDSKMMKLANRVEKFENTKLVFA